MTALTGNVAVPPKPGRARPRLPGEAGMFLVLVGIALLFEAAGWIFQGQSFLLNRQRLVIIVLQMSVVGLLAIGVTQCIITTGIDLSSGSVVAMAAMIAASLAQPPGYARAVFPGLPELPALVPVLAGLAVGAAVGAVNGGLIAMSGIPPFIATLGTMVTVRGMARYYTHGQPISLLNDGFTAIGSGAWPVVIFAVVAAVFHLALRTTRYGKYLYAVGGNMEAARVSGIDVRRQLIVVYILAGTLSGLGGVVLAARAQSGQAGMGMGYELDAIAAAVIGGTSLSGGVGRITGTVVGTLILGVMMSGFTFLGINAYIQDIVKGLIIVGAVVIDQYRIRRRKKA